MTDAQLFQFVDRLLEGRIEPEDFKTLTVADARHLSYFLKQRRAQSQAQYAAAGSAYPEAPPAGPGDRHSYSEREILAELGLE